MGGGASTEQRTEQPYELTVRKGGALGVETESGFFGASAVVRRLKETGEASRSGLVFPGDVIVGINGVDTCRLPFGETMDMLRAARYPVTVRLAPPEWFYKAFPDAPATLAPSTGGAVRLQSVESTQGSVHARCASHLHGEVEEGVGACELCVAEAAQLKKLKLFMQQREFECESNFKELEESKLTLLEREQALDEAVGAKLKLSQEVRTLQTRYDEALREIKEQQHYLELAELNQQAALEQAYAARQAADACREELAQMRDEIEALRRRRSSRIRRGLAAIAGMRKSMATSPSGPSESAAGETLGENSPGLASPARRQPLGEFNALEQAPAEEGSQEARTKKPVVAIYSPKRRRAKRSAPTRYQANKENSDAEIFVF